MTQLKTDFLPELVDESAFIAESATVLGEVHISAQASVWFGAVVRGDSEIVRIRKRTNIQDLCVLHADPGFPCQIGNNVTVGHAAVVHGATVEDDALIGIRAVVLNGATIGAGSIVGAGAVVPEGKQIPANSLAVGIPAKVIRELTDDDRERIRHAANHYVQAAQQYKSSSNKEKA